MTRTLLAAAAALVLTALTGSPALASDGTVSVDPKSAWPGDYVTVGLDCVSPKRAFVDAPEAFGQKYMHGDPSVTVQIPDGTPAGKIQVNGYCRESQQAPSDTTYLKIKGDYPTDGPVTGDGGTVAAVEAPMQIAGVGLVGLSAAAAVGAFILRRRRT